MQTPGAPGVEYPKSRYENVPDTLLFLYKDLSSPLSEL
jgi:hypothetical protein